MTGGWSLAELGRAAERMDRQIDSLEHILAMLPHTYALKGDLREVEDRLRAVISENRALITELRATNEANVRAAYDELKDTRRQQRGLALAAAFSFVTSLVVAVISVLLGNGVFA